MMKTYNEGRTKNMKRFAMIALGAVALTLSAGTTAAQPSQPEQCFEERERPIYTDLIEKETRERTGNTSEWSAWTDWPNAGPVLDDGRARSGHHGGSHDHPTRFDRDYRYVVVGQEQTGTETVTVEVPCPPPTTEPPPPTTEPPPPTTEPPPPTTEPPPTTVPAPDPLLLSVRERCYDFSPYYWKAVWTIVNPNNPASTGASPWTTGTQSGTVVVGTGQVIVTEHLESEDVATFTITYEGVPSSGRALQPEQDCTRPPTTQPPPPTTNPPPPTTEPPTTEPPTTEPPCIPDAPGNWCYEPPPTVPPCDTEDPDSDCYEPPPTSPPATDPPTTEPPPPPTPSCVGDDCLPHTGSDATRNVLVAAGVLALCGGGLWLIARRRRDD